MIAKDLINFMIPPLKVSDPVSKAKMWMEELRLSELPVTDQGRFLGLLPEEALYDDEQHGDRVADFNLTGSTSVVPYDQHFYKVLKMAYSLGVRLVAIMDENDQYIGVVSVEDVVEAFANTSSVNTPGAILVLPMEFRDYSLSEISRIVEMNEAKILSSHISKDNKDMGKIRLTLKINQEHVSHLVAALEERGYHVAESFSDDSGETIDQERYDILMNYLKM